jgi:hypothetical protein
VPPANPKEIFAPAYGAYGMVVGVLMAVMLVVYMAIELRWDRGTISNYERNPPRKGAFPWYCC